MATQTLPDSIEIRGDVRLQRAWEVFERFEALHHDMPIMTPLNGEDDWRNYQAAVAAAATSWRDQNPGRNGDDYLREALEWQAASDDATELIGWNVRIARRTS